MAIAHAAKAGAGASMPEDEAEGFGGQQGRQLS